MGFPNHSLLEVKTKTESGTDFEAVEKLRPMIAAYCKRRGSRDPDGITAEVIAIAWAQRDAIDLQDCRPWLITTARNLLFDEYRARRRSFPVDPASLVRVDQRQEPDFEVETIDTELSAALGCLSPRDREVVLLIAWEELSPAEAARSMGISAATFRVRLHRARRRLKRLLEESADPSTEATGKTVENGI